ncbi:MAG: hypothetical protein LQ349_001721 [Xanthoria aureola]|nr:MAG: hypothetical protein LQ349_001721 [Xanthoria aureola]
MPQTYELLGTLALQQSYAAASHPKGLENSSVLLIENLFNHHVASRLPGRMTVNSQQQVDETTRAVDVVLAVYRHQPILHILVEVKRKKNGSDGKLMDLEEQLQGYVLSCLDHGIAAGIINMSAIWGGSSDKNLAQYYKDPGVKDDVPWFKSFFRDLITTAGIPRLPSQQLGPSLNPPSAGTPQYLPQQKSASLNPPSAGTPQYLPQQTNTVAGFSSSSPYTKQSSLTAQ